MKPLILASASPRRQEILKCFALPWEIVEHRFDERSVPFEGNGKEYVQKIALGKALSLVSQFLDRTIISADTIVLCDGHILNKPQDREDAFSMLKRLSHRSHQVISGIALYHEGKSYSRCDTTNVHICPLSDAQINAFLQTQLWTDKAGAYAIQGAGALLVDHIEGCYYNVVGLPVVPLSYMLQQIGIDLWKYIATP